MGAAFLVSFLASVAGAVCGIGGGVIIKPVLDATGILAVTTGSFLSGCTVLSMSVVSLYKNMRMKHDFVFDKAFATVIAAGGVAGGLSGKALYELVLDNLSDTSHVGAVQAAVLLVITLGTLLATVYKQKIRTKELTSRPVIFLIGVVLGIFSSFLSIGGGPINLVVLFYFFSMTSKQAAMYSIYIIMFSQIASLLAAVVQGRVPDFSPPMLAVMMTCGILGGLAGSKLNKKIDNKAVDHLFIGLMAVIIAVNIYNIYRYI